jgi:hypothetical protein
VHTVEFSTAVALVGAARAAKADAEREMISLRERFAERQREWAREEKDFIRQIETAAESIRKREEDDRAAQLALVAAEKRKATVFGSHACESPAHPEPDAFEALLEAEVRATALALAQEAQRQPSMVNIEPDDSDAQSFSDDDSNLSGARSKSNLPLDASGCKPDISSGLELLVSPNDPSPASGNCKLLEGGSSTASVTKTLNQIGRNPSVAIPRDGEKDQLLKSSSPALERLGRELTTSTAQSYTAASPAHLASDPVEHITDSRGQQEEASEQLRCQQLDHQPASSAPCMPQYDASHLFGGVYLPSASASGRLEWLPQRSSLCSESHQQQQQGGGAEVLEGEAEVESARQPRSAIGRRKRRRTHWVDPQPELMSGKRNRRSSVRIRHNEEEVQFRSFLPTA